MITATGIGRPNTDLRIGQSVRYHHVAIEARMPREKKDDLGRVANQWELGKWQPVGIGKDSWHYYLSQKHAASAIPYSGSEFWVEVEESAYPKLVRPNGLNKTVAVIPQEGDGTLVSLIRKGIGSSYSGYYSGWETQEWEPGGFEVSEWVWLYVVKHSLHGLLEDCVLVPMDALEAR